MQVKWTLNKKQVAGLAAYAAILPASILLSSVAGSWLFVVGTLVSLPLAPLGFMVFWGSVGFGGVAAFFATWLFNVLQGWLMLAPYMARKARQGSTPKSFPRFAIPIMAAIFTILVAVVFRHAIT